MASQLATILERLLDETKLFTRQEWARYLHVTQSTLSQWTHDKTIPMAKHLVMIVDTLRASIHTPMGILEDFYKIVQMPSSHISPHGARLGDNVLAYMNEERRKDFLQTLKQLPVEIQERIILESIAYISKMRSQGWS